MCVRECEELLKCVQRNKDSRLDFIGGSQLQATKLKHTCQAYQKLKRHASCSLQDKSSSWPSRLLVAWTRDTTQPLGQAAKTPCLAKYDVSHSFSPYYIYTLIPTIQRELLEKILREKPSRKQDWLIHNLYLKDSSNSFTLFLSIVRSLRGSLPKHFLTISIPVCLVFWEAVRKEPISYWLMLWSSSGIWEARKEIGSA